MISKESRKDANVPMLLKHIEIVGLMNAGAERAIAESKRMGVPVPLDCDDGVERYELPDGTVVEGDPWHGQNTAPEGWYERFGITPENQPKVKK